MTDRPRLVFRRWRRTQPAVARAAVAVVTVGLLAVGCGAAGSPSGSSGASKTGGTKGTQSTTSPSAIGYSHCMRSHGVPTFPDPASNGQLPKVNVQQLGVSNSQFQAAQKDCQNLLPAGSDDVFPPGEVQQLLPGMLRFSQCMRSHGVPSWPDPSLIQGKPGFNLAPSGLSTGSSQVTNGINACQHLLPSALGGIPVSRN